LSLAVITVSLQFAGVSIMDRIIGRYTGSAKGPLMICIGGIHGNEPAGVKALETVFKLLEREPSVNPAFVFSGRLVGFRGNRQALEKSVRFIEQDLNRMWQPAFIESVKTSQPVQLQHEQLELRELLAHIEKEIADYNPEKLVVLDLHTTTADGGIFGIASDDLASIDIGIAMHAPVITGMLEGLEGTLLHYFQARNFPFPTLSFGFEAGQHEDPISVNRCIAAIVNCMRSVGCVRPHDVENRHDEILQVYSMGLPKVAKLIHVHRIKAGDNFIMMPNYRNFQAVTKGEMLAKNREGDIRAPEDCLILMPLYQSQGNDGFFLVKATPPSSIPVV